MMRQSKMKYEIVLEDKTPRLEGTQAVLGEERRTSAISIVANDAIRLKLEWQLAAAVHKGERKVNAVPHTQLEHGTEKHEPRQTQNCKARSGICKHCNAWCLWTKMDWNGHFQSDDYKVFYSGNDRLRRNRVALMLKQDVADAVRGSAARSDWIITIRLLGKSTNITIIQVYAPTTDAEENDIESFDANIQEEIDHTSKQDMLIITGDWYAKVGNKATLNVIRKFGLEVRNEARDQLEDFWEANNLCIANTCFKQPNRQLSTWTSPDGQNRNQIDNVIGSRRWRSYILSAKTRPGADCGTDHKWFRSNIRVELKKRLKESQC